MRFKVLTIFLLFAIVARPAKSQDEKAPLCHQLGSKKVDVADEDATVLGFTIGHSSLEDVQNKLGKSEAFRISREEESDIAICYVSPSDGTVFVVYSGAMGGWKDITWFALWSQEAAFENVSKCAKSPRISRNLATKSGLRLALTPAQLKGIAGTPTKVAGSSTKYDYVCRREMTEDDIKGFQTQYRVDVKRDPYFDRMSWIHVRFKNQIGTRVEIGRIESY